MNKYENNQIFLNQLADKVELGKVIPFIGAGMSIGLGLPDWKATLEKLFSTAHPNLSAVAGRKFGEHFVTNQYESVAQIFQDEAQLGLGWLNHEITTIFSKYQLQSEIFGALSYLPLFAKGPVITTNFDHAIEQVYDRGCQQGGAILDARFRGVGDDENDAG